MKTGAIFGLRTLNWLKKKLVPKKLNTRYMAGLSPRFANGKFVNFTKYQHIRFYIGFGDFCPSLF